MVELPAAPLLFERERLLAHLQSRVEGMRRGAPGRGGCVLLLGEPGLGKTSVLRALPERLRGQPLTWWRGQCEPTDVAPPMCPLLDCVAELPAGLARRVRRGRVEPELLGQLMKALTTSSQPTVWVIDDAQWLDEAMAELLRYIGRRLERLPVLLLLAARDEDRAGTGLLQPLLGDWPAGAVERIGLQPLSEATVRAWARRAGRAPDGLFERTAGNPFFTAQVLAAPPGELPLSVRAAVLARCARLPTATRWLLDRLSVLPSGAEHALVERLAQSAAVPAHVLLEPALAEALLWSDAQRVTFRHDLVRQALEQAQTGLRLREQHAAVYRALCELDQPLVRRVPHAACAGLSDAVLRDAPRAAAQAEAAGLMQQAASQWNWVLDQPPLRDVERALALEARGRCRQLAGEGDAAMEDRRAALALHQALGDATGQARNWVALARLHWQHSGDSRQAAQALQKAILLLRSQPPGLELADAFSALSHLHLVGDDMTGTLHWGLRALALVGPRKDHPVLAHALNNVGTAWVRSGAHDRGLTALQRSLALAEAAGAHADAARARLNLFLSQAAERRLPSALAHADAGIAEAERYGLSAWEHRTRVRRALALQLAGRMAEAEADLQQLQAVAAQGRLAPVEAAAAAYVRALLRLRQARPGAAQALQRAQASMQRHGVELWFNPTAAALAEAAWLAGQPQAVQRVARAAWTTLEGVGDLWRQGELALWLHRAGAHVPSRGDGRPWPQPVACELQGRCAEAAAAWQQSGCAYDAALALAGGDAAQQREALHRLQAMGALAAAARVRQRLVAADQGQGTRGAYRHAREDSLGLTARERVVLELLSESLSNRAIAQRLKRSPRTVEKHVATLLDKLQVSNRHAAALRLQAHAPADGEPPAPGATADPLSRQKSPKTG